MYYTFNYLFFAEGITTWWLEPLKVIIGQTHFADPNILRPRAANNHSFQAES